MRRSRRVLVVGGLVATLVGASAAVAQAGRGFDIRTDRSGSDGYAHADGVVTFLDEDAFRISVEVSDRCGRGDGDGEGAYVWAQIRYLDGTYDGGRLLNVGFDNDGCGNGVDTRTSSFSPGRKVRWVRVRLDESDGPSGPSSSTTYSARKDNPYTGQAQPAERPSTMSE